MIQLPNDELHSFNVERLCFDHYKVIGLIGPQKEFLEVWKCDQWRQVRLFLFWCALVVA